MSGDPAVKAARRAWNAMPTADKTSRKAVGEAAAREALRPIREECERLKRINVPGDDVHMVVDRLAKFIYPTKELES